MVMVMQNDGDDDEDNNNVDDKHDNDGCNVNNDYSLNQLMIIHILLQRHFVIIIDCKHNCFSKPSFHCFPGDGQRSNVLESLDFALNNAETIPDILSTTTLSKLQHLNLRKAKISPGKVMELRQHLVKKPQENDVTITSLNLDSIKLSGTNTLQSMLGLSENFVPTMPCALTSLSLSGCSLNDKDIKPLFVGIAKGLGLAHVNLSSNRLTDTSVDWLVDSMGEPCAICHLDLSNNKVRHSCSPFP